jgi:hypothetical protein
MIDLPVWQEVHELLEDGLDVMYGGSAGTGTARSLSFGKLRGLSE